MNEQDFEQLRQYAAAVYGGGDDGLSDDPAPFVVCWFGAIAEIDIESDEL